MNRRFNSIAGLTVLVLSGCGQPIDMPTPGRTFGRPIYYGTSDTSPAHQAVVALVDSHGFFCSGTLITDTVVLTAAHCLEGTSPSRIEIFFGLNVNRGGQTRAVEEAVIYPQYDSRNITGDAGLIRLSTPAPDGITPIPHLPESLRLTTADVGQTVDFSGFGVTQTGSDGAKLHVQGTIDLVCPGPNDCDGGEVAARAFSYSQDGGGPCSGDSGGPAFLWRNDAEYVAGITSYGDYDCTEFGVSTSVSDYATWIESFTGDNPTAENCTNGIDDDGDMLVDCNDPGCASAPSCQGVNACTAPAVVGCGSVVSSTTIGAAQVFATSGCAQSSSSRWTGPEVAFELQVPAGADVTAQMQPTGIGDLDLFLLPSSSGGCDPTQCNAASTESGNTAETLAFVGPAGTTYLLVETWDTASPFSLTITCAGTVEVCDNGLDDDGDTRVDCADSDCATAPGCQSTAGENCSNGQDDDGDGAIDCADSDCASIAACQGNNGRANYYDPTSAEGGCRTSGGDARWAIGLALGLLLVRRRRISA